MLDAINPPTSPYSVDIDMIDDSGAATPILSSQADDIILPSEDPESPTNPNALVLHHLLPLILLLTR